MYRLVNFDRPFQKVKTARVNETEAGISLGCFEKAAGDEAHQQTGDDKPEA